MDIGAVTNVFLSVMAVALAANQAYSYIAIKRLIAGQRLLDKRQQTLSRRNMAALDNFREMYDLQTRGGGPR